MMRKMPNIASMKVLPRLVEMPLGTGTCQCAPELKFYLMLKHFHKKKILMVRLTNLYLHFSFSVRPCSSPLGLRMDWIAVFL
jgi:hypothetical protein